MANDSDHRSPRPWCSAGAGSDLSKELVWSWLTFVEALFSSLSGCFQGQKAPLRIYAEKDKATRTGSLENPNYSFLHWGVCCRLNCEEALGQVFERYLERRFEQKREYLEVIVIALCGVL